MRRPNSSNGWMCRIGPTVRTAGPSLAARCRTWNFSSICVELSGRTSWICRWGTNVRRRSSSRKTISFNCSASSAVAKKFRSARPPTLPSFPRSRRPSFMSTSAADAQGAANADAAKQASAATRSFPRPNAMEFMGFDFPLSALSASSIVCPRGALSRKRGAKVRRRLPCRSTKTNTCFFSVFHLCFIRGFLFSGGPPA